ncbi:MAG: hypothetical protein WC229_00515 [Candidatus Paceibacterota bacterium]|jgi:hypothetical protein
MFEQFLYSINTGLFPNIYTLLLVMLPIAMPFMLFYVFFVMRFRWIQMKFVESQKTCLLEIKLPKEITKSPAAMEIFFSHLQQSGAGGYAEAYLDGKTRPWFSCELVSIGGEIKFYVWCSQAKFKNIVEAQLYAQFPNIEIFEAKEDYTKNIPYDPDKYFTYGVQYALTKSDPFPIKTYIDYGLDADQKDEYKIDPMSAVIEFLGSMKKSENIWIQILLQKHEPEGWKHGVMKIDKDPKKANWFFKFLIYLFGRSKSLKEEVKKEIEDIKKASIIEVPGKEMSFKLPNPSKGQQEVIAALERSASKIPFDCMVRGLYIAESTGMNPVNIGGLINSFRQYSSQTLNGFKPGYRTDMSDEYKDVVRFFFPFWTNHMNKKIAKRKKKIFHAYKLRSFFQWPYKNLGDKPPFVLTTEELATIFHFPSGIVSQTPTLNRVPSKKSEAPANLPI